MRIPLLTLALLACQGALSERLASAIKYSDEEILDILRGNPWFLPPSTRIVMEEKLRQLPALRKRAPQSNLVAAMLGALGNTMSTLGRTAPRPTVPDVAEKPSLRFPGAMRKKIRIGPYRVPPTSESTIESRLLNSKGMTNMIKIGAKKPCTGNCMLLAVNANLEFFDGSLVPNNSTGVWLHHCVVANVGMQVKDGTCGGVMEPFFESGNERSDAPFNSPPSGIKSGYHVRSADSFLINTEFMNLEDKEKWVWLTLEYDYLDGFKDDYKEGKLIWMNLGPSRCTGSESNPYGLTNLTRTQQPIKMVLEEHSMPWKAFADGEMLGANSHLHDGGTSTKVYLDGRLVCDSIPLYSKAAQPGMSGHMRKRQIKPQGHGNATEGHISEQPPCVFQKTQKVKKGDIMFIKSEYDFNKYTGMVNNKGELDEVMAVAGVLIAFKYPL